MKTLLTIACIVASLPAIAQDVTRPEVQEWRQLVDGGQFIDLIEPMEGEVLSDRVWGADCVRPRYIDNGIEDDKISYWGGNIISHDDGLYHFFVCGWDEKNPKGHMGWLDASMAFHAVSKSAVGPFKVKQTLGKGHNTEVVKLADGRYMVYYILGNNELSDCRYYLGESINGPWSDHKFPLDLRDRERFPGKGNWFHNLSFATRSDGSVLMVSRGGGIWVSRDGVSDYGIITNGSVYPWYDGKYEDPVIWRDNVQYHMVVNDWYGRVAFYLRSKDGLHWVTDAGRAYAPGIARHRDGRVEEWYKFERMRVHQDDKGRAVQANFAVVDTLKHFDLPGDRYSSKNITMPLKKPLLLEVLNKTPLKAKEKEIALKIYAEQDFDPNKEVDINSLRFGASREVNYGRGAKALRSERSGNDMIVYFEGLNHFIDQDEFAPKLLGRNNQGELIFGYSRLAWVDYEPAILSARQPVFKGGKYSVEVENFGVSPSRRAIVSLSIGDDNGVIRECGYAVLEPLQPYESREVKFIIDDERVLRDREKEVVISIQMANERANVFQTTIRTTK